MRLNLGSLSFNANIENGGGTPAWGTELGQGDGYRFSVEDMDDLFTSLVYTSVPDLDQIYCPLGKGGNQRQDYDFVIAGLYDKVFVNGLAVNNAEFLLLVVKKIVGAHHVGRRTLKYNPRITYRGKEINQDCFDKISQTLGLADNAAWFIDEINVRNQDEIHFTAYVLDGQNAASYKSNDERKQAYIKKLQNRIVFEKKSTIGETTIIPLPLDLPLPQITYGAPGTGKSFSIDEDVKRYGMKDIRTTFHPDSDYSTFVGAYKPQMEKVVVRDDRGFPVKEEGKVVYEKKIVYKYSQQAFLKAYTTAWKDLKTPHVLVIEEINRGNCAQIFGDLFQLLDRNESGFSSYPITPDTDIMQVLNEEFEGLELESSESINAQYKEDVVEDVLAGNKLLLPNNLYIWATMNTSDQSLFPIDSAFKRRWDWKYVPISDAGKQWVIRVNDTDYSWWSFLDKVNFKIWDATHSEDKKLGYFFCKADKDGVITAEKFVGKVLFYIYNDVFKDYGFDDDIFKDVNDKENPDLMFKDFFLSDGTPCENKIQVLLNNLEVVAVLSSTNENHASEEATENNLSTEDEYNEEPLLNDQNETSGNDYTKYSFDGNHHLGKGDLAVKIVERFTRENPDITFDQLKQEFPDTMMGDKLKLLGLIVKAKDLENAPYSYQKKAYGFFKKGRKYTSGDGIEYCVSNYWNITNIQSIIDYAVEKGWDVTTEN